ncbi:Hpt domain-containing protein [Yoonia sp.]|uniref:Hpt domain-containing protein n=1 Tax=Yoonia sp. TaxID=2212373 RepID=UPI003A4E6682
MAADSTMRDVFFEECEDLIAALSDGLGAMRDGQTDDETVNAVFRAVHSVKGAAGAFALDDLVGFAHAFETVLDAVRSHRLPLEDRILHVLQRAGDVLADLIDAARDGSPANQAQVDPVVDDLRSFLGDEPQPDENFIFDALTLSFDGPTDAALTHVITFRPSDAFYISGNDPFLVVQALQSLGQTRVSVDTSHAPTDITALDWRSGYFTWQIELDGPDNDISIREVFQFVDDLCDLTIRLKDAVSEQEPAVVENDDVQISDTFEQPSATALPDRNIKRPTSSLRVDPERVDRLINAVGELIINQSVISQRLMQANRNRPIGTACCVAGVSAKRRQ